MKQYVVGFMFDRHENVVLIRKNRPEWQRGLLNGVGGKIEPGETCYQAMVREFMEETGAYTDESDWEHVLTIEDTANKAKIHFLKTQRDSLPLVRTSTDEEVVIRNARLITDPTVRNARWIIPLCIDGNSYHTIYAVERAIPVTR